MRCGPRYLLAGVQPDGDAFAENAAGTHRRGPRGGGRSAGLYLGRVGRNPYLAMLALADAILVTGDSANMVGEAASTGRPSMFSNRAAARRQNSPP